MSIDLKKIILAIIYGGLIIAVILSFASCSSSRKVKQSSFKKSDSTGTTISQASGTREVDSSSLKSNEQSFKEEVTINFADEQTSEDPIEKAKDLAGEQGSPAKAKKPARMHNVNIGGKEISSDREIKSLTIKTAGKTTTIDLTQLNKKDSGQTSSKQTSDVVKNEGAKGKVVERQGASVLIWIGLGIALIAGSIVAVKLGVFAASKKSSKNKET